MKMKSAVWGAVFLSVCTFFYAQTQKLPLSSQKLVPAGHWVYDAMMYLALEQGEVSFVQNAPLSVAELKRYLLEIDYDRLSNTGKKQFERVSGYFRSAEGIAFRSGVIAAGLSVSVTPELYYKSNSDIDWSFNYYYKNNLISAPVYLNVADAICIESDVFIGKNYWAANDSANWCNAPLGYNDFEFLWPRTAYISTGLQLFGESCINFQLGRGGLSVGATQTGSIFMSENFETEGYAQLSFFSPRIRYAADVIEVDVNKFLYLHRIEARPFKRFQLGVIEGTYVNAPLELRYLNPLMIMHSMSPWEGYEEYNESQADGEAKSYGESRVCAYFGVTFDWAVCKNVRVYGVYAQNEIQIPSELESDRGQMFPDSLGGQLGIEVKLPSAHEGVWITGLEGYYSTPWLYIKHDADWSLYRERFDNLKNTSVPVTSWIGSPFGPDSIAAQFRFGYEKPGKWSCEMQYRFLVQGENGFNLFYNADGSTTADTTEENKGRYRYYPVVAYDDWLKAHKDTATDEEKEAAKKKYQELARDTPSPTGTPEYGNRILLKGTYAFSEHFSVSAQTAYSFVFNSNHESGNFQQGVEFAFSSTIKLF